MNINASKFSLILKSGSMSYETSAVSCSKSLKFHRLASFYYEISLFLPQVYHQSIAAVCAQDWPRDRMLVQILDDSDDRDVQFLIKTEVQKWQQKGINILYRHRLIRTGYKAGNLKSAMSCNYVKDYEFVAIFDADFQPRSDFLKKTIPHFKVCIDFQIFILLSY